jgi:ferredoxin
LQAAYERNLAYGSVDDAEIIGDLKSFCVSDFKNLVKLNGVEFLSNMKGPFGKVLANIFSAAMCSKPGVEADMCIGCGKCLDVCPAKAITMNKELPKIDRNKCIRCYCCQELCPKGAMKLQRPFIARALNK